MCAGGEHGTTVVDADRFVPDDEEADAREVRPAMTSPDPVPEVVHRLQRCPMRQPPGRRGGRCATTTAGPDRARVEALIRATGVVSASAAPGLLRAGPDQANPSAAGLFRADRLAPHRPSRARSRERRPLSFRPRSPAPAARRYASEEPVAEINAAFGRASLGIVPTVRHADYIGSWLEGVA